MTKSRVSVVIPTRDNLSDLPKALASVQAQRIDALEIIVADDGSSDGTFEFLDAVKKTEPRLRIIETGGKGPANARNNAMGMARSPLIAFLDSDDIWYPGKLKRQLAYLEGRPDVGFSFTDYLHVDPEGNSHGTCFEYWHPIYGNRPPQGYDVIENAEADILSCNVVGTSTVVARAERIEAIGGFSTALRSSEDWDLWLRLARNAPVACTSIVTTSYLMRPGSESMRRLDRLTAMAEIIDGYRSREEPLIRTAIRKAESRIHAGRADIARMEGRYWNAVTGELMALVKAPTVRKARAAASDVVKGMRSAFSASEPAKPAETVPANKSSAAA